MRRSRFSFRTLLAVLALIACGEPSDLLDRGLEPENGAELPPIPSDAAGVQVARVVDPETPVFAIASEEGSPEALALLAAKDAAGNARNMTGFAFVDGDDYLSLEYDALGRPEKVETPSRVVRWFDYAEAAVSVERIAADGSVTTQRLSFEATELEAFRAVLPPVESLGATATAARTGDPLVNKAEPGASAAPALPRPPETEAARAVSLAAKTFGCAEAPVETARAHSVFGAALHLGLSLAECTTWLNKIAHITERYRDHIDALGYSASCVGGLATTEIGLGALLAAYSCPKAAEAVVRAIRNDVYALRVSQGFALTLAAGDLVRGSPSRVTVRLTTSAGARSLGDSGLGRVVADLTPIGGPPRAELRLQDGFLQWTGDVTPFEVGRRRIPVSVGDGALPLVLELPVFADPNVLSARVRASSTRVTPGTSIDLFIEVEGGQPPYRYYWREQYPGRSAKPMPDLRDVARFRRTIDEPVRFDAWVMDGVARNADAGGVSIELCSSPSTGFDLAAITGAGGCVDADVELCRMGCSYRAERVGCVDVAGACEPVCIAIFASLSVGGPCAEVERQYRRCTYSTAAFDLGCSVLDGGRVCAESRGALERCEQGR